jgi:hypothetical protein
MRTSLADPSLTLGDLCGVAGWEPGTAAPQAPQKANPSGIAELHELHIFATGGDGGSSGTVCTSPTTDEGDGEVSSLYAVGPDPIGILAICEGTTVATVSSSATAGMPVGGVWVLGAFSPSDRGKSDPHPRQNL